MKTRGFTMIELIFVIVILGILAAIAIPKLMATRDDAEIVNASANLETLQKDLIAHYLSQGKLEKDIHSMTNIRLANVKDNYGEFLVGRTPCLKININQDSVKEINISVVEPINTDDANCKRFQEITKVKKVIKYGILPIKR